MLQVQFKQTFSKKFAIALVVCFYFIQIGLSAQNDIAPYQIHSLQNEYILNDDLYYLADQSGEMTLEKLSNPIINSQFEKLSNQIVPDPQIIYWVKFKLHNQTDESLSFRDWKLFLGNADLVQVFVFDENKNLVYSDQTGAFYPASEKQLSFGSKEQRVNLNFDLHSELEAYIRYEKKDFQPHGIDIRLKKYDFYQSLDYVHTNRRDWFFLGFLLTMILFNIILFFRANYKAFLYHGLFITGVFIFTLDHFGVTNDLPWIRDHGYMVQLVNYLGLLLMDFAYFQFIRHYLTLWKTMPVWDRVFKNLLYVKPIFFTGLIIYYYSSFNEPHTDQMLGFFLVSEFLLVLYFMFPLYKLNDKKAYFLIAGSIILFIGLLLNTISLLNGQGMWIVMTEIGLVSEIICFSFGLAFRLNELTIEEQASKQIKELDAFKTEFYTNITHEFRTPLTAINGMIDFVSAKLDTGDHSQIRNALGTIQRNSGQLLNLINQLLSLSRLESKSIELSVEQADVIGILKRLSANTSSLADSKNKHFLFQTASNCFYMDLDIEKFETVMHNLLSNALKFTKSNHEINLSFDTIKKEDIEYARISVKDTGIGIAPEKLPFIFDRFYRAEDGGHYHVEGSGIGLAIAKELVHLMSGSISVKSYPSKGTEFTVLLPIFRNASPKSVHLKKNDDKYALANATYSIPSESSFDKPILLIVEDSPDIVEYLSFLLEKEYKLEIAMNGEQGLQKAFALIPDLIISDVMMPKKDGLTLCAEIKENEITNHIPIVLLTAKAGIEHKLTGLRKGADAYLSKPFHKEELFIRLHKLNELRSTLQKKYSQFSFIENPASLKKENGFLHKVNACIESNLQDSQFSVEELAKSLFMSRMQLHRKLKALVDLSASNYIRNYRIYKARPLLHDRDKSIGDIAWEVGFQDPNYFSKSFQNEFGKTPSGYRETL